MARSWEDLRLCQACYDVTIVPLVCLMFPVLNFACACSEASCCLGVNHQPPVSVPSLVDRAVAYAITFGGCASAEDRIEWIMLA
jgi:hypothetical protein